MKPHDSKQWLIDRYWGDEMSLHEIAEITGVTFQTIYRRMVFFDIERRRTGKR